MGQHKHNQTAIKAKNGEIKPKEKPMTKAQRKRVIKTAAKVLSLVLVQQLGIERYENADIK